MNFLVDAQLPRRLAYKLRDEGHDAIHTLDLPDRNRTSDAAINELSLRELRIVITKDTDFVNSFLLSSEPHKLLLVSTGNIANVVLEDLFATHLAAITTALDSYDYIELTRDALVIHS